MNNFLTVYLKAFDEYLSDYILRFLTPYQIGISHDVFTQLLPQNLKVSIYLTLSIIPFLIFKLLYPYNKLVSVILVGYLITGALMLFVVFIGFFDLLFAY